MRRTRAVAPVGSAPGAPPMAGTAVETPFMMTSPMAPPPGAARAARDTDGDISAAAGAGDEDGDVMMGVHGSSAPAAAAAAAASSSVGVGAAIASISSPTNVQRVLHVEWDPTSGTFKGLPDVWSGAVPVGISKEEVDTTGLPTHLAPTVPPEDVIRQAREGAYLLWISTPFNVKREHHVEVDPSAPTGFRGLPEKWEAMLTASGISREEVSAHPLEVLGALRTHMEGPTAVLPTRASYERHVHEASLISPGDPRRIFAAEKQIGAGASGTVFLARDRRSSERVAIKMARGDDLGTLKYEIALQKLSAHECIVNLREAYLQDEWLWIVLEYVHGGTLTEVRRREE